MTPERWQKVDEVLQAAFDLPATERAALLAEVRTGDPELHDEALEEFAVLDPRKARVVELRYFGGLSLEETAEAVGLSLMTVRRDWQAAKAWLYRRLKHDS